MYKGKQLEIVTEKSGSKAAQEIDLEDELMSNSSANTVIVGKIRKRRVDKERRKRRREKRMILMQSET